MENIMRKEQRECVLTAATFDDLVITQGGYSIIISREEADRLAKEIIYILDGC